MRDKKFSVSTVTRCLLLLAACLTIGATAGILAATVANRASSPLGAQAASQTAAQPAQHPAQIPGDPWTPAQTVQPQDLLKELASASHRPVVVCVGFHPLFEGAHVPGAVFHGSASASEGLDDLKKWAQSVPRSANVVVYCGCCPMTHCPNIRRP